jgi:hypothetical protein
MREKLARKNAASWIRRNADKLHFVACTGTFV